MPRKKYLRVRGGSWRDVTDTPVSLSYQGYLPQGFADDYNGFRTRLSVRAPRPRA